jgi:hypothetical protein
MPLLCPELAKPGTKSFAFMLLDILIATGQVPLA